MERQEHHITMIHRGRRRVLAHRQRLHCTVLRCFVPISLNVVTLLAFWVERNVHNVFNILCLTCIYIK